MENDIDTITQVTNYILGWRSISALTENEISTDTLIEPSFINIK